MGCTWPASSSVQELSKGKWTTDRERHTGEGIFFTSKAVDLFRLTSSGVRWTVDNLRHDTALGVAPVLPGTSVLGQIDPQTDRILADVFREVSEDHAFVRTRPVVKLFGIGTIFVSRSEARRLLDGLDASSGKKVVPINMNSAVEFMIRRGAVPGKPAGLAAGTARDR